MVPLAVICPVIFKSSANDIPSESPPTDWKLSAYIVPLALMFPLAVIWLNCTLFVVPRPWILPVPAKILPDNVLVVIRVDNEPLSVFNAEILEVTAVILVENEPLSVFKF